jgi:murein DD-endopeptidase MepM/ murein hydrolase activator NlpD
VEAKLNQRVRWISATPAIAPVKGIFTSGFGFRSDPLTHGRGVHQGIDIAAAPGQPVRASADGVVVKAGTIGGLGQAVYVVHGFGVTTRYGHMSRIEVRPGQRVKRGDVLGRVGNTGRSTGYHLHYEVRVDGDAVNPLAYILDTPGAS